MPQAVRPTATPMRAITAQDAHSWPCMICSASHRLYTALLLGRYWADWLWLRRASSASSSSSGGGVGALRGGEHQHLPLSPGTSTSSSNQHRTHLLRSGGAACLLPGRWPHTGHHQASWRPCCPAQPAAATASSRSSGPSSPDRPWLATQSVQRSNSAVLGAALRMIAAVCAKARWLLPRAARAAGFPLARRKVGHDCMPCSFTAWPSRPQGSSRHRAICVPLGSKLLRGVAVVQEPPGGVVPRHGGSAVQMGGSSGVTSRGAALVSKVKQQQPGAMRQPPGRECLCQPSTHLRLGSEPLMSCLRPAQTASWPAGDRCRPSGTSSRCCQPCVDSNSRHTSSNGSDSLDATSLAAAA